MGRNAQCANQCTRKCGLQVKVDEKSFIAEDRPIEELALETGQASENFHYHVDYLVKRGMRLSASDLFWRQAYWPMCYLHYLYFNKLIDDFLEYYMFE